MKNLLCLFLPVLLSCSPFLYGSGGSSSTKPSSSSKTCLSKDQYIRTRKAISRCVKWKSQIPKLKKELYREKMNSVACDAANKKLWVDLKQARKERNSKKKDNHKFWVGVGWGSGTTLVAGVVIAGIVTVFVIYGGK